MRGFPEPKQFVRGDKEVASATLFAPDGGFQGHRSGEMTPGAPSRPIAVEQTQANEGATAAGTEQGSKPWNRAIADQV